jgi:hypothetical protein
MSSFKTKITRELAAEYGRQAVQITESGEYVLPSSRVDRIAEMVRRSSDATVSYRPGQPFQESFQKVGHHEPAFLHLLFAGQN